MLKHGLDQQPLAEAAPTPTTPHEHRNLRGANYYKETTPC